VQAEVVTVAVPQEAAPAVEETSVTVESIVVAEASHQHEPVLLEPVVAPPVHVEVPVAVTPAPIVHQPEQGDLLSAPAHPPAPAPLRNHEEQAETAQASPVDEPLHLGQQHHDGRHS
jgi:hypothetical protein